MTRLTKLTPDVAGVEPRHREWIKENVERHLRKRKRQTVTFGTSPNELRIRHGLGAVPSGWSVVGQQAAGSVYAGDTASDKFFIYLKSDTTGLVATIEFF